MDNISSALPMRPLGIVAGEGMLPFDISKKAEAMGRKPIVLVIKSSSDSPKNTVPWYLNYSHKVVSIGEVRKALDYLKSEAVQDVVFAGRIKRPNLLTFRPDALGASWLVRLMPSFGRDDALLRKVITLFEEQGLHVVKPQTFLEVEQITSKETHWGRPLTLQEKQDISSGAALLSEISPHDIGQAVTVVEGRIYGIEAVEGTNGLLRRTATYKKGNGPSGVLVKMAKKQQDDRIDLPVIGLKTVEEVYKAKLSGIALKEGDVIILDPEAVKNFVEDKGLFLYVFGEEFKHHTLHVSDKNCEKDEP